MDFQKRENQNPTSITIVDLAGKVDLYEAQSIRENIRKLARENSRILLNMEGVTILDSSGLGALIASTGQVEKEGGELRICNLTEGVKKLINIANLSGVFNVYETEEEALLGFEDS